MDLLELNSDMEPTSDLELNALAARIRPLPASIVPSKRFMEQTRSLLLALTPQRVSKAA